MGLNKEDLKKLLAPFPKDAVGVKIGSTNRDKTRAMLVLYLAHVDVYSRIEQVDSDWSCETTRAVTGSEVVAVGMKLTIKGVTRENAGEGGDFKSAYSDALKRAAMLFGIGRYLYDAETVWVEYSESRDKFKVWTKDDYDRGLKPGQQGTPTTESESLREAGAAGQPVGMRIAPKQDEPKKILSRGALLAEIDRVASLMALTDKKLEEWATEHTGKGMRTMSLADLEGFLEMLLGECGRNGIAV